jgi:hypothetical protein
VRDEEWPVCTCGLKLAFLLQLAQPDLPPVYQLTLPPMTLGSGALLQLFVCCNPKCGDWVQGEVSYLLRWVDRSECIQARQLTAEEAADPFSRVCAENVLEGWTAVKDHPHRWLSHNEWKRWILDNHPRPLMFEKLGGFAYLNAWQLRAQPRCAVCSQPMDLLIGLAGIRPRRGVFHEKWPVPMFPPGIHVFYCHTHTEQVAVMGKARLEWVNSGWTRTLKLVPVQSYEMEFIVGS